MRREADDLRERSGEVSEKPEWCGRESGAKDANSEDQRKKDAFAPSL